MRRTALTSAATLARLSYEFIESTPVDLHRLSLTGLNGRLQVQLRALQSRTAFQLHVSGDG